MATKSEQTLKAYKFILDWAEKEGIDFYDAKATTQRMKEVWPKPSTFKTRLGNLIGALKNAEFGSTKTEGANITEWNDTEAEVLAEYSKILKEHSEATQATPQEATEKEKENWLDWEDVMKLNKMLKEKFHQSIEALEDAILVALYTDTEPCRNDYAKVGFTAEYPNWLDLKTGLLTIRQHKTAKTEGSIFRQLPYDVLVLIHLLRAKEVQRPMLFWEDEAKLSARLISIFERHTNKKIGSTLLRHIFITHKRKGDTTLKEKAELAAKMGHSQQTQELYRRPELE